MANRIEITTPAIKKHLKGYTAEKAIAEYVWNGFDAGASKVEISFMDNGLGLGGFSSLKIVDNGMGISFSELNNKFKPYFVSEKKHKRNISLPHGQNGYGRFTFLVFASDASWETVYNDGDKNKKYIIKIKADNLEKFPSTQLLLV